MIIGEIKRFLRDDGLIKVSRNLKEIAIKANTYRENIEKTVVESLQYQNWQQNLIFQRKI